MVRLRRRKEWGSITGYDDNVYLRIPRNELEFPTPEEESKIIIFLGAGASKSAGVPDTKDFVVEFLKHVKQDPKKKDLVEPLEFVINKIKSQRELFLDIEVLMEILERMKSIESDQPDPIATLFVRKDLSWLKDKSPKLLQELRKFIREKGMPSTEKVGYFFNLMNIERGSPLNIFTVNYDTCIEQMCEDRRLKYSDGFELRWNPEKFEENNQINLFKLHGSVIWYRASRAGFVKLPLSITPKTEIENLQLMSGEKLSEVMLYPTKKDALLPPMFYLMNEFGETIKDPGYSLLIVVGYSFRDEYIKDLIWEGFRHNQNIRMILISPNANKVYKERLKFYGKEPVLGESSLYNKVALLQFKFETIATKIDPVIRSLSYAFAETKEIDKNLESGPLQLNLELVGRTIENYVYGGALYQAIEMYERPLPHKIEKQIKNSLQISILCTIWNEKRHRYYFNQAIDLIITNKNYDISEFRTEGSRDNKLVSFEIKFREMDDQTARSLSAIFYEIGRRSDDFDIFEEKKDNKTREGLEKKLDTLSDLITTHNLSISDFVKKYKADKLQTSQLDHYLNVDELIEGKRLCWEILISAIEKLKYKIKDT